MRANAEREKYIDDLARAFHREYCKVFLAPPWEGCGTEYRRAVEMGVVAVADHIDGNPRNTKQKNRAREQSIDTVR